MWERDPFGTPDECIEKIKGIIDAGCRSFSFRFASLERFEQVERFIQQGCPVRSQGLVARFAPSHDVAAHGFSRSMVPTCARVATAGRGTGHPLLEM